MIQELPHILTLAPVDLQEHVNGLSTEERRSLCEQIEVISDRAAFVSQYLGERHGYGCGDQGHDDAVKAANKARRKVRNAFGFDRTTDIKV